MDQAAPPPVSDPLSWASAMAVRLRYLQANLTDETPENRQAYLEDEVKRALQAVPASRREACLAALGEKFPTFEAATVAVGEAGAVAAPQSPEEVINLFFQTLPQLTPEQREHVTAQLAQLGLVHISMRPLEGEPLAEIQQRLRMTPDDAVDAARLGKLFSTLAEITIVIDQLAWNVWKSAAPKSAVKRDNSAGDLRTLLRRSLTGDQEASAALVTQQLERTRQLVAGLLAALGPAGRNFARRYLTRYSPEAIKDAVKMEGGATLFGNPDARFWKKYSDLAHEISEASIETDFQDAVVKYAEDLMRGSTR